MRDTIDMAREAGEKIDKNWLERFADLVRADERETMIAKLLKIGALEDGEFIAAIRARGNT